MVNHSIISKLIEAKEVSPIYDRRPDFIDIFIDRERIILRPPNYYLLSDEEKRKYDDLHSVVVHFNIYKDKKNFIPCNYCSQYRDAAYEYRICKYAEGMSAKECFRF